MFLTLNLLHMSPDLRMERKSYIRCYGFGRFFLNLQSDVSLPILGVGSSFFGSRNVRTSSLNVWAPLSMKLGIWEGGGGYPLHIICKIRSRDIEFKKVVPFFIFIKLHPHSRFNIAVCMPFNVSRSQTLRCDGVSFRNYEASHVWTLEHHFPWNCIWEGLGYSATPSVKS